MSRHKEERGPECILCGKCLSVCPLVAATGREELAPRSKALLASMLRQRPDALNGVAAARLASLCLGCGRCAEVCAQGLRPAETVARLRAEHPGWREWLWKQWIQRAETLWPLARHTAGSLDRSPLRLLAQKPEPGRLGLMVKSLCGLDRSPMRAYLSLRDVPEPQDVMVRSGLDMAVPEGGPTAVAADALTSGVLLFSGCAGRHLRPEWDDTARALLAAMGLQRIHADFACCGSTLGTAGLFAEQRAARERNLEIWRAGGRGLVLTYCASCLHGLRAYADEPELFHGPAEVALWRRRVAPLSRLLKSVRFMVSDDAPQSVGYHRPCHTRGTDHDAALLRAVLGGRFRALPDRCCGFGGPLRLADPESADKVARQRVLDLDGLPQVLTGCTACALQLAASAPKTTITGHWLDSISQPLP